LDRSFSLLAISIVALAWTVASTGGGDGVEAEPMAAWSEVSVGRVVLRVPERLRADAPGGKDSLTARYRAPDLSVSIDLGLYSDPLTDHAGIGLTREPIEVDGRSATLVRYRDPDPTAALPHVLGVHVPDLGDGSSRLTVLVRGAGNAEEEEALRILRSIRIGSEPRRD
jgi:hypothetical protein